MPILRGYLKPLFILLTTSLLMLGVQTSASAGIVTTTELVEAQQNERDRERIHELLARDDVQKALESQGVDTLSARQRVSTMTNSEVQTLAAKMDQLPAGAGLSTTELLLLIIIIILII